MKRLIYTAIIFVLISFIALVPFKLATSNAQCVRLAPAVSSLIAVPTGVCADVVTPIAGTHDVCVLQGMSFDFRGGNTLTESSVHIERVGNTKSWQARGHTGKTTGACPNEQGTIYVKCLDWTN